MYSIRSVEKDHLRGIINLYLRYSHEQFLYEGDRFLYQLLIDIRQEEREIFVARHADQIIGCVYALKHLGGSGWLGGLFVDPRHRQRGIGSLLLRHCLGYLKRAGCIDAFLFTDPNNLAAVSVFEKLGFDLVYRRIRFYRKIDPREDFGFPSAGRIESAAELDLEKLKDVIYRSPEFQQRRGVILFYYYPVNLKGELTKSLVKSGKVIVYSQRGNYEGVAIFQEAPGIRIGDLDFVFRDELAQGIKKGRKGRCGEINLVIGSEEAVQYLFSHILVILKQRGVENINYYSYIGDVHISTVEKLGFTRVKPINVMKYVFTP
jgi:ribosomal protein S18 acetylase RimI-like enzyme